ncbi:MAG: hypothetical protein ACRCWF_01495 [Beijerinckiaceae bacterium]
MPSSKPPSFALLATIGLVVACSLVLCWPWLSGGVTVPWDSKAHFQPQLSFLASSFQNGQSPFWNPYVFSGHPQIADPQSLIFSPPFMLLALFVANPGMVEMDAVVFGSLIFGSLFIVLYFRDRGWHEAGAILAALSFAFGGAAAWRIQHVGQVMSIAYLPIALWLLDRALQRFSIAYGFGAGVLAGLMLLGRDQVAFLGLLVLAAYTVLRLHHSGWAIKRSLLPLLSGAFGGALTVAVPMVMTLLLAADSNRPEITLSEAGKGSLHPWSLLTAIIPHLYGIARPLSDYWGPPSPDWGPVDLYLARNMATFYFGMLPLLLLMLLPFLWRFKPRFATTPAQLEAGHDPHRRDALFLVLSFVILMLYSLGRYTPVFGIVFTLVPGIDKFRRPADALFVACAFGSMAAGYALHRWIVAPQFRLPPWAMPAFALFSLASVLAGGILAYGVGRLEQTVAPLASAACFVAATMLMLLIAERLRQRKAALLFVISLFMVADLGWNNAPNESTGLLPDTYDILRPDSRNETFALLKSKVAETTAPDRIDRVEMAGIGFHWPNATMNHRLHHTLGYNPLRSATYSTSVGTNDHIAGPDQRLFTPLLPSYKSLMADMTGMRFIAIGVPMAELYAAAPRAPGLPPAVFNAEEFPLVARTGDAWIYENPRALPRVLFAGNAVQADFNNLIKTGQWPAFDPRETVVLDRLINPAETTLKTGTRTAKIISYRNTEVRIEATSTTGGFIVLNDAFDDWWRVEVNGKPAVMERANVTFRAVAVPAGTVEVRFVFAPFRGALAELMRRK